MTQSPFRTNLAVTYIHHRIPSLSHTHTHTHTHTYTHTHTPSPLYTPIHTHKHRAQGKETGDGYDHNALYFEVTTYGYIVTHTGATKA